MLEKALEGSKKYWAWLILLSALASVGFYFYLQQYAYGLGLTGMHRDVSWGLYIGQFTFLVGVAASAVMLVIPYYLHDFKKFGKIVILGEFLAIAAVLMCMLFIMADMGQPGRFMNIMLHPSPQSVMFWDFLVLAGYLALNAVIGWVTLGADRKGMPPPTWIKPFIYLSIPWAISIHTVTAFLYAGLPGRHFWLTAIMAARFLASAFAGGPALLLMLALIVRKLTKFDPGKEPIQALAKIVTYAMFANVFFLALEFFTAFYSQIPGHMHAFDHLYAHSATPLVPMMWVSTAFALISLGMLFFPAIRKNETTLVMACIMLFTSLWIDKGFGLVIGGFVPNPFDEVHEYWPTLPEGIITVGIWAIGFLVLTMLYKVAISVREQTAGVEIDH
ncbi:MAG: menaquinol oxidoreductase [Nitrospirae bacterium GWC2_57_13]|jgi:Ni/Fe-hydrogenase subunit HybB-like protein|nr:MAG: menaquinol oxidoreductase [Nitrospirae bacterium GWC1_57_7]OGW29613.1 MAG: menaquinol oxidoreductase [Nitrospirae bacterium GWC2_57_13]OGW41591.1 MAG: menaquinol oxidoreductase [Nitrospirae bacterium GWD2_57_8]